MSQHDAHRRAWDYVRHYGLAGLAAQRAAVAKTASDFGRPANEWPGF